MGNDSVWSNDSGAAVTHVIGTSRFQSTLFPPVLDEALSVDHPVRVIDAFVDALDLGKLGFSKVEAEATGRPPYRPSDLLKLYIYGYLNQVRSSRRLEREAARNIEVLWLIDRLKPSFKTIADFRKDHANGLIEVCRAFVAFCRGQSLLGGEVVAIDGTKISAAASRYKVITPKKLAKQSEAIERRIAEHLAAMDEADARENASEADAPCVDVAKALTALKERREEIARQAEDLAANHLKQKVLSEPDAKLMRTANHGYQVAYNAQIAVDDRHKLIVAFDLTNEGNDTQQLHPMAEKAKEALGVESLTVVADTGYSSGEQGEHCEKAQITAIVPRPQKANTAGKQYFDRSRFTYDVAGDTYRCPAGQTLTLESVSQSRSRKSYANLRACQDCALRPQCTKGAFRRVNRTFHEDTIEAMHQRATTDPRHMKTRREIAEHPFGTIKWMMARPRFLLRGLPKAKAEWALSILGYNLKRVIAILGVPLLLNRLRTAPA
jgi:transposase